MELQSYDFMPIIPDSVPCQQILEIMFFSSVLKFNLLNFLYQHVKNMEK